MAVKVRVAFLVYLVFSSFQSIGWLCGAPLKYPCLVIMMQNMGKNNFYCTVNRGICKLFVKTKTRTSQIPLLLAHGCMFLEE